MGIPFPTIHGNSGLPFPEFGNEFYCMKKVAKAERKVSGAGDITVKKTPKVVAPEPREPHTKRLKEELEEAEKAISTASRKKTPQQVGWLQIPQVRCVFFC